MISNNRSPHPDSATVDFDPSRELMMKYHQLWLACDPYHFEHTCCKLLRSTGFNTKFF